MSFEVLIAAAILSVAVIFANLAERRPELRTVNILLLLSINMLYLISFALNPQADPTSIVLAIAVVGAASVVLLKQVRVRLVGLFPRRHVETEGQATGQIVGFDPDSPLHMTALVLCIYLFGLVTLTYSLAGGTSGIAEQVTQQGEDLVSTGGLFSQMAIFLVFATIGAGLGTRRSVPAVLQRLGLRAPTLVELGAGAGAAAMLFVVQFGLLFILTSFLLQFVQPEDLTQQNELTNLISGSITTMTTAFLVAFTAAVGEEIAFRGALQPVFGLWPTSILFAMTHLQYAFAPASLVILVVGIGFGWIRQRYNTTTAIVTHFLYNFGIMVVLLYGQVLVDMTVVPR